MKSKWVVVAIGLGVVALGMEFVCVGKRQPSRFCHIAIPAPDMEDAKRFYEEVFAWKVDENVPAPGYWFFHSGNVGGALHRDAPPISGSVVLFIEVDDMKGTLAAIERHGGTIITGRRPIGEADPGYTATFYDPNRNQMGIYSQK